MKQLLISAMMTALVATTAQAQTKKTVPPPPAKKMVVPTYQQPATITSSAPWGAPGFQHEVEINLSEGSLRTYKLAGKSYTDLTLMGAYNHDLGQNVQVGADVGLRSFDSKTYITLVATGTYNLDANYSDSVFFKGGLGLFPVSKDNGDIKNEFGLYVAAGKRFKLWDHVNYKPFISIAKISDQDAEIAVQFLNISLNWN